MVSLEESHLAKQESVFVVNFLKMLGLRVCMITGDNQHSAMKVAKHLGIYEDDIYYEALPETKKRIVSDY